MSLIKDKTLGPTNLQVVDGLKVSRRDNYYLMGDVFCQNIMVTAFPKSFEVGLLSHYINDPNVRLSMITYPLDRDLTGDLKREYKAIEERWRKTTDPTEKESYRTQLQALHDYIQEQVASNDRTMNVLVVFTLRSDNYEDLKVFARNFRERLRTSGFKLSSAGALNMNLLKTTNPLWIDHGIQKDVYYGLGVPMSTTSLAGMYPYIYSQLKDPNGFLYGREFYNGGIILWDPMAYENDENQARKDGRLTGNVVVVGESGSGKTTDMALIVMWFIRERMQLIWIDPENKNEHLTKRFGGTYIPWGTKAARINLFQLRKASFDEDEDDGLDPWDTQQAIYSCIDDFKTLLRLYTTHISDDTLAWVGEITIETFKRKGITFDSEFRYLSNEDYPILSEFNDVLQERIDALKNEPTAFLEIQQLQDLSIKIKPMLVENKFFFDGHTTIQLNESQRNIISFGTRLLNGKSAGLKDALNFLMFRYAWSLCLDDERQSAFVIDEAHDLILGGKSAEQIAVFYRRSRKYHNSMVIGTQETRDFSSEEVIIHGRAIFNNSTYKIIKKLSKEAVEFLKELTTINSQEASFIQRAGMGDSLFVCGTKRLTMKVFASEQELNWIDPNRRIGG